MTTIVLIQKVAQSYSMLKNTDVECGNPVDRITACSHETNTRFLELIILLLGVRVKMEYV